MWKLTTKRESRETGYLKTPLVPKTKKKSWTIQGDKYGVKHKFFSFRY